MSEKTIQERVKEYQEKVSQKNEGMPEAGAIAYSTVYIGSFPVNLTQRADNVYDAFVAFKMGVDLLGEVFGVTLEKEIPAAPEPTVDSTFPQEPVYEDIEPKHTFTVKSLAHSKTQSGKDVIKVFLVEDYKFGNKKYGITAFGGGPDGWERWAENAQYAPPEGFGHVVVSDPKDGGKYANVLSFQK